MAAYLFLGPKTGPIRFCLVLGTRIHPQGKVAPRMFLELARPKSWIWSGGVPVSFKMFKNSMGFFIQDSISALQIHKIFKVVKCGQTDGRTDGHLDPVLDHFGAATVAIPGNFGFRT